MNLPSNPTQRRGDVQRAGDGSGHEVDRPRPQDVPVRRRSRVRDIVTGTVQLLLALVVLGAGYFAYQAIVTSAPKAQRKAPERVARLVDVVAVAAAKTGPVIQAWGEVVAAQTLVVRPEISGTLAWVHPDVTPGGRLSFNQVVARFNDDDLKLALSQAENAIAQIDARILLEKGQAEIGKRELPRLSRNLTEQQRALILREPQMAALDAERATAVSILQQTRNALKRATVRAPFDALVLTEQVEPGSMLSVGAEAATLVASDRFHVTLAVPARALRWMRFDGSQTVDLTQPGIWAEGAKRHGKVLRLNSALTATGRMAEVIVEIPDPLATKTASSGAPVVLLGSFVRGTITAEALPGAILLDRAHLRDGDTVWVMSADGTLDIRDVQIEWRGGDHVLVTDGLAPGEKVVTTTLSTVSKGMALRTREKGSDK